MTVGLFETLDFRGEVETPQPVSAAGHYKYLVVQLISGGPMRTEEMQTQLNKQTSDGWEFVAVSTADNDVQLIFRKAN